MRCITRMLICAHIHPSTSHITVRKLWVELPIVACTATRGCVTDMSNQSNWLIAAGRVAGGSSGAHRNRRCSRRTGPHRGLPLIFDASAHAAEILPAPAGQCILGFVERFRAAPRDLQRRQGTPARPSGGLAARSESLGVYNTNMLACGARARFDGTRCDAKLVTRSQ